MSYELGAKNRDSIPRVQAGFAKKALPADIRKRSFSYALRAINLFRYLQKQRDGAGWILGKQYLRSACSIGANVVEAQSGESRADFVHKLGIALKEARESLYWLELLAESGTVPRGRLRPLMEETGDIIRMLSSIILTTKQRSRGGPSTRRRANS
jgi:four helix bundle protein